MSIKYIAELCQNHLGKIDNIEKMVEECAFYGAKIIFLHGKLNLGMALLLEILFKRIVKRKS